MGSSRLLVVVALLAVIGELLYVPVSGCDIKECSMLASLSAFEVWAMRDEPDAAGLRGTM